jgi:ABC-2 type transport system ATP-binding protein
MLPVQDERPGSFAHSPAVEVADLHKHFAETVAVGGVSFSVEPGTVAGLLGPNGAGKTTIINCLSTLLLPDKGRASVAGYDVVTEPQKVREAIALTGQFAAVDNILTGRQNLVLFGRLLGLRKPRALARAAELFERFNLVEAADKPVSSYSGGMRRQLDVAASLVVPRPVLFLDEPTTGLDPRSRQEVWGVVRELRKAGTAILLTTQYLEEADALTDQVFVVDRGTVIAEGAPDDLKERVGGRVCRVRVADADACARAVGALRAGGYEPSEAESVISLIGLAPERIVEVIRCLDQTGVVAADVSIGTPTLDDVFLTLTGGPRGEHRDEQKEAAGNSGTGVRA